MENTECCDAEETEYGEEEKKCCTEEARSSVFFANSFAYSFGNQGRLYIGSRQSFVWKPMQICLAITDNSNNC